jgi:hypothetical protein
MLRLTIALCFMALLGCSDGYTDVQATTTPLITGFESYATAEQIKEQALVGLEWSVMEISSLPPGDRRPPFNMLTLSVPSFSHQQHTGELRLHFFNNRLESTCFYPSDPAAYVQALRQAAILTDDANEGSARPFTYIWVETDYRGKVYVGWTDRRLQAQSNRWIRRYS